MILALNAQFLFSCLSSGSHIENWHSILRNGLVNASYTKLQVEYKVYESHRGNFKVLNGHFDLSNLFNTMLGYSVAKI